MTNLYSDWLQAFSEVGISAISDDTCAKLLAILYVFGGGQEFFCFNQKCVADVQYATKKFNIGGSKTPTKDGVVLIKKYVADLLDGKDYLSATKPKQWAIDLIQDRYEEVLQ